MRLIHGALPKKIRRENPRMILLFGIVCVICSAIFSLFFIYSTAKSASAPALIAYQGKLLINSSSATTTQSIIFLVYDDLTGGTVHYTASGTVGTPLAVNVVPSNGLFSINLGGTGTNDLDPDIFKDHDELYLEVQIGGETLTPRKRITAVPYAFNARYLNGIISSTNTTTVAYVPVSDSGGNFNFNIVTSTGIYNSGLLNVVGNATFGNITSGTWSGTAIDTVRGGIGQDSSVWTGFIKVTGGEWATSSISSGDVSGLGSMALLSSADYMTTGTLATTYLTISTTSNFVRWDAPSTTLWDSGYSDRLRWDGNSTGLVPATGRASLELGSMALTNTADYMTTGTLDSTYLTLAVSTTLDYEPTQTFTAGSVVFASSTGKLTQDNSNLFWDDTNNRLGIGTTTPNTMLTVVGTTTNAIANFASSTGSSVFYIGANGYVGIGTTTPAYSLSVVGDIDATGTIRMLGADYGQYFINSAGIIGQLWSSDGSGRGAWLTTSTLGLLYSDIGGLGTMATQDSGSVNISGGTISFLDIPLGVADGGTGVSTFSSGGILYGNDESSIEVSVGTPNYILLSGGTDAPSWISTSTLGLLGSDIGGFTAGSVVFASSTGKLTQDNSSLFWDDTNNRLGIGLNAPNRTFYVSSTAGAVLEANGATNESVYDGATWIRAPRNTVSLFIGDDNTATSAAFGVDEWGSNIRFGGYSSNFNNAYLGDVGFYPTGGNDAGNFRFSFQNVEETTVNATPNARVGVGELYAVSNVMIGTTTPTAKLSVQGTAGNNAIVNFASSTGSSVFYIGANGYVGIGTTTLTAILNLPSGTTAANGINFGGDVSLYRHANNGLKTEDNFAANSYGVDATQVITAGRIFKSANGTVAAPSYSFSSGPTTGMFWETGERLGFTTNGAEKMRIDENGYVGIGTTTPDFKLTIFDDGGIMARGTQASGAALTLTGAGTRLMWYPRKSAFRAGYVRNDQWDDAYIGTSSIAMGSSTLASGDYGAIALGLSSVASGDYGAIALGNVTVASGDYGATALGIGSVASGVDGATALGFYTVASGFDGATALGNVTLASGGWGATALGFGSVASGNYGATALGYYTTSSANSSFALGRYITVSGSGSFGVNVSTSTYTLSQINTIALMGGNVGIGTTTPSSTLFVEGTAGGTSAWSNWSDERLKTKIFTITNALDKVRQLRGVEFEWKEPATDFPGRKIGFIAQETLSVLPQVVNDMGGVYGVSYGPVVALLTEAIKEQQAMLDPMTIGLNISTSSKIISFGSGVDPYNVNIKGNLNFMATSTLQKLTFANTVTMESQLNGAAQARAFIFDALNFNTSSQDSFVMSIRSGGSPVFSVSANGDARAAGNLYAASAIFGVSDNPGDLAERVDINIEDDVQPGDVLKVDEENPDMYRKTTSAYEPAIAGVVSTNPTIIVGNGRTSQTAPMAMMGRVPIKISVTNGNIRRGDILVASDVPGAAMKYAAQKDDSRKVVGIIGIALENAEQDGKILGLIRAGWVYNKTEAVSEIQRQVEIMAAEKGVNLSQNPIDLGVNNFSGNLAYNDVDFNNNSLLNVKSINGGNNRWAINEEGFLIAKISTTEGDKKVYGVTSESAEINLSGSGQLRNGEIRIDFVTSTRDMIDATQDIRVNLTLTSGEGNGIFVSAKDGRGFTVKELGGGMSVSTFDWLVIAKRKMSVTAAAMNVGDNSNGSDITVGEALEQLVNPETANANERETTNNEEIPGGESAPEPPSPAPDEEQSVPQPVVEQPAEESVVEEPALPVQSSEGAAEGIPPAAPASLSQNGTETPAL